MNKTNKIIVGVLLVAVLLLGIGYAAIQSVTLNINGTATADPSQSNFKVMFTGTPEVSNSTYVTAGITDDTNATISVKGLTSKGDKESATYTIQNVSTDISADLAIATTNSNTEYFIISSKLAKTSLKAGEATTVTVTVELIKTPIQASVDAVVGVQMTAMPVEPGMEGTSENINDYSQTPKSTLALVTNNDIGDYIDLGNNVIDGLNGTTGLTTDDWRILYKNENYVYAILADFLPADKVPATAGLNTNPTEYPYSVWSDTDRDTLLNGLKNETAWSSFANGISGATVTGAPTLELLLSSYKAKTGTEFDMEDKNANMADSDLYVPRETDKSSDYGDYWLADVVSDNENYLWYVDYEGEPTGHGPYDWHYIGARPVVSLPISTEANIIEGVWTITME